MGFPTGLAQSQQLVRTALGLHGSPGLGLVEAVEGRFGQAVTLLTFGTARPGPGSIIMLGEPQRVLADLHVDLVATNCSAAQDYDVSSLPN